MPGVYLEVFARPGRDGQRVELTGTSFHVGRSKKCAVTVDSDVTSREHAVIELREETWYVRDLDSRNGTFVNGHRVQAAAVRPGDLVVFGESGPKVRVLSLDPDAPMEPGGEDETRYIRLSPRDLQPGGRLKPQAPPEAPPRPPPPPPEQPAPPPRPQPPRPQPSPTPPSPQPAPPRAGAQLGALPPEGAARKFGFPWLGLLGAILGAAVAWSLQNHVIDKFPYKEVLAPVEWILRGLGELLPEIVARHEQWILIGVAALYYGLVGVALQRPIRRLFWILAIAAVHVLAVFA